MDYSKFLYGCFVVSTLAAVLTQYIRVDGKPNLASAVIIVANAVNIVLDYVFLSSGMGMASASFASFIGYTLSFVNVNSPHAINFPASKSFGCETISTKAQG
jgi:Na+-driven multidrug efflux pump